MEHPTDDEHEEEDVVEITDFRQISDDDERAELEAELARIDASWKHRAEPKDIADKALDDLESKLSDLDM